MKKILLIFTALMFVVQTVFAATVATRVSGNNVLIPREGKVVTFDSVTSHLVMWTESTQDDVYVDIKCVSSADNRTGYFSTDSCVILLPARGSVTPNVIELDFSTKNLAFVCEGDGRRVNYIVTGVLNTL